jgi:hypothetical protein
MGSWNKTCGLSNLPIMEGEDTYVFVLERKQKLDSPCYATHLYRPLLLPFISTYNDYGGGENSRGAAFPVVMNAIKEHLVELPVGENEYHDIAVSKQSWGEELFFDAAREARLKVNYYFEAYVTFVMIRKDLVDNLVDTYVFEKYVGDGKGTSGHNNCYINYKLSDVIADIDSFFDAIVQINSNEKRWFWPCMDVVAINHLSKIDEHNLAADWMKFDCGARYSGILQIRNHIVELLMDNQRDLAKDLMVEHLKGMFVDNFMEMTRKSWIPGGHEGSQSQEYEPYRLLITSMNNVMNARDARYAEENE